VALSAYGLRAALAGLTPPFPFAPYLLPVLSVLGDFDNMASLILRGKVRVRSPKASPRILEQRGWRQLFWSSSPVVQRGRAASKLSPAGLTAELAEWAVQQACPDDICRHVKELKEPSVQACGRPCAHPPVGGTPLRSGIGSLIPALAGPDDIARCVTLLCYRAVSATVRLQLCRARRCGAATGWQLTGNPCKGVHPRWWARYTSTANPRRDTLTHCSLARSLTGV
jgi:hypothetical protein